MSSWRMCSLSPTSEFREYVKQQKPIENRKDIEISAHTNDLLFPGKDLELMNLKKLISERRSFNTLSKYAVKIQSTFRMFVAKKSYRLFINNYRKMKNQKTKLVFAILLLQTKIASPKRKKMYKIIANNPMLKIKCDRGFYISSFSTFTITNLIMLPNYVDQRKIVKFVKLIYANSLRNIFEIWRIFAAKARKENRCKTNFKLDEMSRVRFGLFYTSFYVWLRYTKLKNSNYHKNISITQGANIPQWNRYIEKRKAIEERQMKADNKYLSKLKQNTFQAFYNLIIFQRRQNESIFIADLRQKRRLMLLSLRGWMKFLVDKNNLHQSKRYVFHRWLSAVHKRKHFELLYETLQRRHNLYLKYHCFAAFIKNKKICEICQTSSYIKLQQKPSLALYFIALLQKDSISEAICHCFNAWLNFIRRRRKWNQFVYADINESEYVIEKKRTMAILLHKKVRPNSNKIAIVSKSFKRKTLNLYSRVVTDNEFEGSNMFLFVNDAQKAYEIQEQEKNSNGIKNIRKLFFNSWQTLDPSPSLFQRLAIINVGKKIIERNWNNSSLSEKCIHQFQSATKYLTKYNITSEDQFRKILKLIQENNRRAYTNRKLCIYRDRLIIRSHEMHNISSNEMKKLFQNFTSSDKIMLANQDILSTFKVLVPIIQFTQIDETTQEGLPFFVIHGCSSRIPNFQSAIKEIHNKIAQDNARTKVARQIASHFDKLIIGNDNLKANKINIKTNIQADSFQKTPSTRIRTRRKTGFLEKLALKFPGLSRKAKILHSQLEEKHKEESAASTAHENDDDGDEMITHTKTNIGEQLALERSENSTIFNDLVANTLSEKFAPEKSLFGITKETNNGEDEYEKEEEEEDYDEEHIQMKKKFNAILEERKKKLASGMNIAEVQESGGQFSNAVIKSISVLDDLPDPQPKNKYQLFLEILFGRQRHQNYIPENLRTRLIEELNFRKNPVPTKGIITRNQMVNVSPTLELYRKSQRNYESMNTNLEKEDESENASSAHNFSNKTSQSCKFRNQKQVPQHQDLQNSESYSDQNQDLQNSNFPEGEDLKAIENNSTTSDAQISDSTNQKKKLTSNNQKVNQNNLKYQMKSKQKNAQNDKQSNIHNSKLNEAHSESQINQNTSITFNSRRYRKMHFTSNTKDQSENLQQSDSNKAQLEQLNKSDESDKSKSDNEYFYDYDDEFKKVKDFLTEDEIKTLYPEETKVKKKKKQKDSDVDIEYDTGKLGIFVKNDSNQNIPSFDASGSIKDNNQSNTTTFLNIHDNKEINSSNEPHADKDNSNELLNEKDNLPSKKKDGSSFDINKLIYASPFINMESSNKIIKESNENNNMMNDQTNPDITSNAITNDSQKNLSSGGNGVEELNKKDDRILSFLALDTVNKVVFHILEKAVIEEEEGLLVDIDPDDLPTKSQQSKEEPQKQRKFRYTKKITFRPFKSRLRKNIKKKKNGPIIISQQHELTPSMIEIVRETSPLKGLLYTGGNIKKVQGSPSQLSTSSMHSRQSNTPINYLYGRKKITRPGTTISSSYTLNTPSPTTVTTTTMVNSSNNMPISKSHPKLSSSVNTNARQTNTPNIVYDQSVTSGSKGDTSKVVNFSGGGRGITGSSEKSSNLNFVSMKIKNQKRVQQLRPLTSHSRNDLQLNFQPLQIIKKQGLYQDSNGGEIDSCSNETKSLYIDKIDVPIDNDIHNLSRINVDVPNPISNTRNSKVLNPSNIKKVRFKEFKQAGQKTDLSNQVKKDDDYNYNAVAVQYRRDKIGNLDAMIGPTGVIHKKKKNNQKELQHSSENDYSYHDYIDLNSIDLVEMMNILPYVISEAEIDEVISHANVRNS